MGQNYIAGEWRKGASEIANINPSDTSDIIGHFAQASATILKMLFQQTSASKIWAQTGLETRYNALMAIGTELMAELKSLARCSHVKKASH